MNEPVAVKSILEKKKWKKKMTERNRKKEIKYTNTILKFVAYKSV